MSSYERQVLSRRPEYTLENMGRVFTVLNNFSVALSPEQECELDQLFCGIDFADQLTDNPTLFPDASEHILSFLIENKDRLPEKFPQSATETFIFLKGIVKERGTATKLETLVNGILLLHNRLSSTHSISEYIQLTRQEAVKSAEMAFLFFHEELSPHVKEFFIQSNILGNLADNLLDLDSDYAEGKIVIKPSKSLRFALKKEMFGQLTYLSWHYPNKRQLINLSWKYITMLLKRPNPKKD